MALINVIKFEAKDDKFLVWKYPYSNIKLGSQLIVNEGQQAIFVKGGQALDVFDPGTYTLQTANLPLIDKLINLPFGGDTPFSAEIWFANTTVKRDLKWGTPSVIPLMDPVLNIPISVRSFGKWGVKIRDIRSFITQIVGSQSIIEDSRVSEYFIGEIIQALTKNISSFVLSNHTSILQIALYVSEISNLCSNVIKLEFEKYGIDLVNFNIESINIPEQELLRIQDIYAKTLEVKELSKANPNNSYATIKAYEVLNNAASNTSSSSSAQIIGLGLGLNAGLPLVNKVGDNLSPEKPSSHKDDEFEIYSTKLKHLKQLFVEELITEEEYNTKRQEIVKLIR